MPAVAMGRHVPWADEDGEPRRVHKWRFNKFTHLGFDREDATALAMRDDVDSHRVDVMLRAGCSHHLVLQIVL